MKTNSGFIQKISVLAFSVLPVFPSLIVISSHNKSAQQNNNGVSVSANVVVLELFTSQGCSSCPPADALLAEYATAHDEHIIPLSFHVDYWNRLGWADPFSSSACSNRQQWYSRHLPKGSVYTPQLIVNGRDEAVGNNRNEVKKLVQKELAVKQSETILVNEVSIGKKTLTFHYKTSNTDQNHILNIALVQKQATTNIKAGENEGVTVTNHNIVRSFITQPISNDGLGLINLPTSFKAAEYALVLYVQSKKNLFVTAAVMKDLK